MPDNMTDPAPAFPPPLSAAVALVLLGGPHAAFPADLDGADEAGKLQRAPDGLARIAALWRQHEVWLRAEAARRDIEPMFGEARALEFFGQHLARRLETRRPSREARP
jgi:hypothetical protein